MSRLILVIFLSLVIAVSAVAIGHFYTDYVDSLQKSLNSPDRVL